MSYFDQQPSYLQNSFHKATLKTQCKQSQWEQTEGEIISFVQEQQAQPTKTRYSLHRPISELGIAQARYQVEAELFMLLSAMSWSERRQDLLA